MVKMFCANTNIGIIVDYEFNINDNCRILAKNFDLGGLHLL